MTTTGTHTPGWHPDPWDARMIRYHDGAGWTGHVNPAAPVPQPGQPVWQYRRPRDMVPTFSLTPPPLTEADKRQRRKWLWIGPLIGLAIAAIIVFYSLPQFGNTSGDITYSVTGSGEAMVTYSTTSGIQQVTVALPWSHTLSSAPTTATVLAQAQGKDASITCTIRAGSSTVSTNTSSGDYTIASCSH